MNIWQFQRQLSRRLLLWSGISTLLGILMLPFGKFWRGVGSQFIGWALVNAGIAAGGDFVTGQRRLKTAQPDAPQVLLREGDSLKRLLWINAGLDIFYMLGGAWMMGRKGSKDGQRGSGLGIIVQGLFLFVFDIFHATRTPTWPWGGSDPR
jgi:hypothetical protein